MSRGKRGNTWEQDGSNPTQSVSHLLPQVRGSTPPDSGNAETLQHQAPQEPVRLHGAGQPEPETAKPTDDPDIHSLGAVLDGLLPALAKHLGQPWPPESVVPESPGAAK